MNDIKAYEGLTANQILNLFRNLYYNDGNATEKGIIANAINDILPDYHRQKAEIEQLNHKYELAVAEREANVKGFTEQIETLTVELQAMRGAANSYKMHYENARAEAVKEFAERLKKDKIKPEFPWEDFTVTEGMIDNLVKEFTEGKNDE